MAIGYLPISQDFPCSGIPTWAIARKGVVALDISTGDKYIQNTAPYGNAWILQSIKNIYLPPSGGVQSVTGLNTDNTDPANPVIQISVDGVSIIGDGTPGNPLVSTGGSGFSYTRTLVNTTPYSITSTFGYNVYYVDATAGAIVIDFPTAVGNAAWYIIKKIDSSLNTVTLNPNGAETIDGLSTQVIKFKNTSVDVYSDNSNLFIA